MKIHSTFIDRRRAAFVEAHAWAAVLIPVDEDYAGVFQGLLDLEDVLD
jgi:hypothetical protein